MARSPRSEPRPVRPGRGHAFPRSPNWRLHDAGEMRETALASHSFLQLRWMFASPPCKAGFGISRVLGRPAPIDARRDSIGHRPACNGASRRSKREMTAILVELVPGRAHDGRQRGHGGAGIREDGLSRTVGR